MKWTVNYEGNLPVDEVVIKPQHMELGVLIDEEAYVEGEVVRQARLVRRYLAGVVGDDVSCRKRLLLISKDVPASVRYRTLRWRSTFVTYLPYAELPSSFIVSAIIALSGSTSPARRAAETDSPKCRKHASRWYSTTW